MSDFQEINLGKITQKQFDSMISGFDLDLVALFKMIEQDAMDILNGDYDEEQIISIFENMLPDVIDV